MTKKTTKVEPKKTAAKKKKPQTEAQKKAAQQRAFKKHEKEHRKALLARLRSELENLPNNAKENRLRRIGQLQEGCGSHEPLVAPLPDTTPPVEHADKVFEMATRDGILLKIVFNIDRLDLWSIKSKIGDVVEVLSKKVWEHRKHVTVKALSKRIWKYRRK